MYGKFQGPALLGRALGVERAAPATTAALLVRQRRGGEFGFRFGAMNIRYHVELSEAERCELTALVGGGKHYARKIKRAQILLAADSGLSDDDIAAAVAVGGSTVYRTKRRFVEGNLEAALNEEPRAGADRKLTGNEEALLVATACSSPPEGRAAGRWSCWLARWSS